MRKLLLVLSIGFLLAGTVGAKTPDGQPPSVETVCDNETGAAFGLCNAYCEAMDCDSPNHHASDQGCASVKRNFEKKTGRPLPCEATCPCGGLLPLFADIVSGAATVTLCIADATLVSVVTDSGAFSVVFAGPPPFCSDNAEPPFVELTATEELVCRAALREAAARQGIPCETPE